MVQQLSLFHSIGNFDISYSFLNPVIPERAIKPVIDSGPFEKSVAKKKSLVLIPLITIHPNSINYYKEVHWENGKPNVSGEHNSAIDSEIKFEHLLKSKRSAEGKVSKIARRKIFKAVDYLLLMANPKSAQAQLTGRLFNFRIAFITLTLPSAQIHSDNEIKRRCLNSLLLELKQFYKIKNYLWRAEKQENGNIHFHIIIDKFVDWNELRNRWNRIINKLGYVNRYRESLLKFHKDGFKLREDLVGKWSEVKQRAAYKKGISQGWQNPNSTDIHSIKKILNIKAYLSKYLTKNQNEISVSGIRNPINDRQAGRIWGCSKNLSNPKGAQMVLDTETEEILSEVLKNSNCRIYKGDYFEVFSLSFADLPQFGGQKLFEVFLSYLKKEFDFDYQGKLF